MMVISLGEMVILLMLLSVMQCHQTMMGVEVGGVCRHWVEVGLVWGLIGA